MGNGSREETTGHQGMRLWTDALRQSAGILFLAALIGLTVNHVRSRGLPLMENWSQKMQQSSPGEGESLQVSMEEAQELFMTNGALFLDARSQDAYRSGHIQGALSLPFEEFEERFSEVMGSIPPEFPIITYCDGESCSLSRELAAALLAKGYVNVRALFNGWRLWQLANLPVESR